MLKAEPCLSSQALDLGPYIYEEQIKLKVGSPDPDLLNCLQVRFSFPNVRVVSSLQNSYRLVFIFRLGKPFVLLAM